MQKTPIPPVSTGPGYERIRKTLETILASEKFLSAPQMSAFLRYVVVQAATGNKGRIKAYTVAVDALGKPETFDPQNDPVVRVLAGRLRSTLSAYYEQHPDADVIIEMKPGSYVPTFILRKAGEQTTDDAAEDDLTASQIEPDESTVLSVDLAQAANNQWASNKASVLHTSTGPLEVSDQQTTADGAHSSVRLPSGNSISNRLLSLVRSFLRFPKLTIAASLVAALMIGMYLEGLMRSAEPEMLASKPLSHNASSTAITQRSRPDSISLFVSATAPENSLTSQVNSTMSSVLSETGNVRVYRMLRPAQVQQFWPEDYHVSLNVLPLLDETQVSVQLVDAQTGRIAHAEILHLSAGAPQGLSSEDLQTIMEYSRRLVREDGPLTTDYKNKINSP